MPDSEATGASAGFTLVLGAGGRVGIASHAGVLRALHEIGGLDPRDADLVIGTSAGSVIGTLVRSGWSTSDIWTLATRTGPIAPGDDVARPDLFERAWRSPSQLLRRALGSAYVVGRSVVRGPTVTVPHLARRVFPGGFLSVRAEEVDLGSAIPERWPDAALWVCTVDIESGRRVVLGRGRDRTDLRLAVMASCAIPGYYQPVRIGSRTLVDGGVHSTTNLDLAGGATPRLVVASSPMGHDPRHAPGPLARALRRPANRRLATDRLDLGERGHTVVLVRPGRAEVAAQGLNPMRGSGLEPIAVAAYDAAARYFARPHIRHRIATARRDEPVAS